MSVLKTILIDVKAKEAKVIEVEDELEAFYEMLNCRVFDIAQRMICGTWFDIMCDDEGLLVDDPVVSAVNSRFEPMLVGNLMFFHNDGNGNLTSLDETDLAIIAGNMLAVFDRDGSPSPCVLLD